MKGVDMELAGTVGVLFSSEVARYSSFTVDLMRLEVPEGTVVDFAFGEDGASMRNDLIERAIARDSRWVWFISERHSFSQEILQTMLSRDQPIVAPVVLGMKPPFYPLAYKDYERDASRKPVGLTEVIGPGSLVEIDSAEASGLLIRREVLDDLEGYRFNGDDDAPAFCDAARRRDWQVFLDTSVRLGNRCAAIVYPQLRAGQWHAVAVVEQSIELTTPLKHI
jgi:hypothetical protein